MKVLITGVNGFTGRCLAKKLSEDKSIQLFGTDIQDCSVYNDSLYEYFPLDLRNYSSVYNFISTIHPASIYNLAGLVNSDSDFNIYNVNFVGSLNILEAVRKIDNNIHLLFVGSSAEYGAPLVANSAITEEHQCRPSSAYAISKYSSTLAIQNYVSKYGLKAVIVRPFNIIGVGMPVQLLLGSIISRIKKIRQGSDTIDIEVGNIHTYRDFIDIDDVIDAYLKVMSGNFWGQIFNICSGKPTQIKELLEIIITHSTFKINFRVNKNFIREDDVTMVYGSYDKANLFFGFKPKKSLNETLKEVWDYEFKTP